MGGSLFYPPLHELWFVVGVCQKQSSHGGTVPSSQVKDDIYTGWKVHLRISVYLTLPAQVGWEEMPFSKWW